MQKIFKILYSVLLFVITTVFIIELAIPNNLMTDNGLRIRDILEITRMILVIVILLICIIEKFLFKSKIG